MRKTDNFELNLLDAEDFVNKEDLNENAKKIDAKLKEHDTPEYDIYKQKEVEELEAGESLITAIRKLAKAVKTLIEHLANKKNPHEVSAEDVGLGEVTNESKQKMFTTPVFEGTANDKDGYGFGDTCTSPTKIYRHEIEGDVTDNVETEKTVVVGINAGLHLDGNLEAANFKGIAANFTTENWNMVAAAPLVKELKDELDTLNTTLEKKVISVAMQKDTPGWYRIASSGWSVNSALGGQGDSIIIEYQTRYDTNANCSGLVSIVRNYNWKPRFVLLNKHHVTNVISAFRIVRVGEKAYLECYYNSSTMNRFYFNIIGTNWEHCNGESAEESEVLGEFDLINNDDIQSQINKVSASKSFHDSGNGNLITTEAFLNHLIDVGVITSGKYMNEKLVGTYSYAAHYIISDSPIELHLTSCLIELFGRYDGSLTAETNNFYMRITTGMPSISSRTSQRKRCFVFNASGGGSGWCELSNNALPQIQRGTIYLNNAASGKIYYEFAKKPTIILSCNGIDNVKYSYSDATETQATVTNNTGTTVGIDWVAIGEK